MVVCLGNGIYLKAKFRCDVFGVVLGADKIGKRNKYLGVRFKIVRRFAQEPAQYLLTAVGVQSKGTVGGVVIKIEYNHVETPGRNRGE